jgi:hypothetical protein
MTLERTLSASALDSLFERTATQQYTKELLFSSCVDMLMLIVCNIHMSINAAYKEVKDSLPVSLTSVYNEINAVETHTSAELVRHTASNLAPIIDSMNARMPSLLDGYRVKILDGNHLTATERRLSELRNSHAGPLPGQCLVVMDPALMLVMDAVPCEDAYKNERSLATDILKHVERNDVWIADRNFCTSGFMREIASREAFFVIRQHGALDGKELAGRQKKRGRVDTGAVFEQDINIDTQDNALWVRRITIRLEGTTRDGDNEIHILSNLPKSDARTRFIDRPHVSTARLLAESRRNRP